MPIITFEGFVRLSSFVLTNSMLYKKSGENLLYFAINSHIGNRYLLFGRAIANIDINDCIGNILHGVLTREMM